MSVEAKVKAAVAFTGYPFSRNTYTGTADTYFVLMTDTAPTNFADDAPRHERYSIMLHLVSPITFNEITVAGQIKAALFAAGFTYPSTTPAGDDKQNRLVFEFEYAEAI